MTAERPPQISVLLPVYNAERYLQHALLSVLDQTFRDFEVIAIDDGSQDRSYSILRSFEQKDNRLRVICRENRGLVETLNEAIGAASGEFLARMDADDICLPQRFERQIAFLKDRPEHVAVGSRVLLIDADGRSICDFIHELSHEEIDSAHLSGKGGCRICHPASMMRKSAVVKVGGYRSEFEAAEDIDLFLRLAELGKLSNIPEILLRYRQHPKSVGYLHSTKQKAAIIRSVQAAYERRGLVRQRVCHTRQNSETVADAHRKWAWWALMAGNVATARKHTLKAVIRDPLSRDNIKLAACAIRGR